MWEICSAMVRTMDFETVKHPRTFARAAIVPQYGI
jgi:hypothetical protein